MTDWKPEHIGRTVRRDYFGERFVLSDLGVIGDEVQTLYLTDYKGGQYRGQPGDFVLVGEAVETLNERVYDALIAAGQKALADEFADANGAGQ